MHKHVDIIIVGQGIAGTTLAVELIEKGQTVLVVDNGYTYSSSMVAAGMVNPIVFKRLTKSWNVDTLMPAMHSFFKKMAKKLEVSLVNPIEILKIFTSIQEERQWIEKSDSLGFEEHLGELLSKKEAEALYDLKAPFGGGIVKSSCYIDLPEFLTASRAYFNKNGSFFNNEFDITKMALSQSGGTYAADGQSFSFKKVVFCEGHKAVDNPYFKDLPFNLAKGEIIEFKQPALRTDRIINKNGFILPTKQNTFKVGATYEWKDIDQSTTATGKAALLEKLSFLKDEKVEVVGHVAGIRPTVKDRRPLLGQHAEEERLYIFNGLGTKGALTAPYYAQQMVAFILQEFELEPEVDIKRFR